MISRLYLRSQDPYINAKPDVSRQVKAEAGILS